LKITFLGTGTSQGVQVIGCDCQICKSLDYRDKRTRTSVFIDTGKVQIIIDTGPDFRAQVLRERIRHIDAVLFTHQHKDHTAGLDDIRSFNFIQKMDIPIYGRKAVLEQLKREFSYIFEESNYPGIPRVKTFEIINETFKIGDTEIIPIETLHHKLPVFGFRINDFTYITDANKIPEEELKKITGSKALVINALQKEAHISHFNLEEAINQAKECNCDTTYFTHISHKLGLHGIIEADLPDNIRLAYDGLQLDL